MSQRPVNERQLEVLRWIADGCPDGVMTDSSHRTSAVALRNRGLAKVSKRGGWHAEATEAGRHYLEHGDYPTEESSPSKAPRPPRAPRTRTPKTTPPEPAEAATVIVEGGPTESAAAVEGQPRRVIVPERLVKPHPLVAELRDSKRGLGISKGLVPRALRIVHALALASEREGWAVSSVANTRDRWGNAWDSKDLFVIDTGELREGIRLGEENDRTPHTPTAYELKQKERWSYTTIPEWDYQPSGRIYLEIDSNYDGRRHRWSDRQRWSIEEKLDQLLLELEERSAIEREKRLERERREVERQVQVDLAVAQAKVRLAEEHRAQALLFQAEAWQQTELIRGYLEALRRRIETIEEDSEREQAMDWLRWCDQRVEAMDPLNGRLGFPEEPEATPEALAPFLPSWLRRGW